MKKAPIPKNELTRIASLYALDLLDTPSEERFDRLTKVATQIFHVPISTLTLIDANREWFKSCQGLSKTEGDRAISFCGHALVENEILVINDTKKDERFSDNPMVVGEPFLRFYAGAPIKSAESSIITGSGSQPLVAARSIMILGKVVPLKSGIVNGFVENRVWVAINPAKKSSPEGVSPGPRPTKDAMFSIWKFGNGETTVRRCSPMTCHGTVRLGNGASGSQTTAL